MKLIERRTMNRRDIPAVVSLREIADMRSVTISAASNWSRTFADFPAPFEELAIGSVYVRQEAVDFLERHPELGQVTPAKLTVEQKEEIRSRIAAGDTRVSVIAREYGVSRGLIYKFAGDLLTPQDEVG
jgi:hypothetical protein